MRTCQWCQLETIKEPASKSWFFLCNKCFHEIYTDYYRSIFTPEEFRRNIDIIKSIHEIHEKKKNEIEFIKPCYICGEDFTYNNENKFKTLCNYCYKEHCLPFRGKVTSAEMAEIINKAKKTREEASNNHLAKNEAPANFNPEQVKP